MTYPLYLNNFSSSEECCVGCKYEGRVYMNHGQFKLDHIDLLDEYGNEIQLEDCVIEEKDRSYKDLYWYYNRNEDYWMNISFTMPNHDVFIKAHYVVNDQASILSVDVSKIAHLLDKTKPSYLYCFEETYNGSRHTFIENDLFHYNINDVLTFGIYLKEPANLLMEIKDKFYKPVCVDEKQNLYIFGSLDEDDGWDDIKDPRSEKIQLIEGLCPICFFVK